MPGHTGLVKPSQGKMLPNATEIHEKEVLFLPQHRKTDPIKYCQACGKLLTRKVMNGRLEDRSVFLRRKYCDMNCWGLAERKPNPGNASTFHWRARKHRKKACEACGDRRSLVAHHIDQNREHNEPENIQTLCKWCHDFWHSTAKRLGREIAGKMPPLSPNS